MVRCGLKKEKKKKEETETQQLIMHLWKGKIPPPKTPKGRQSTYIASLSHTPVADGEPQAT